MNEDNFKKQILDIYKQSEFHGKNINEIQVKIRRDVLNNGFKILYEILKMEGITTFMSKATILKEIIKLIEEIEQKISDLALENNILYSLIASYETKYI